MENGRNERKWRTQPGWAPESCPGVAIDVLSLPLCQGLSPVVCVLRHFLKIQAPGEKSSLPLGPAPIVRHWRDGCLPPPCGFL